MRRDLPARLGAQEVNAVQYDELRYVAEQQDPSVTLETRDLVVKVIDNTGLLAASVRSPSFFNDQHRCVIPFVHHLGYHGIRTLYHKQERRNVVAPFVSWLNLQGVELAGIDSDPIDERAYAGVARGWPMRVEDSGDIAALHLDPLPRTQMRYCLELRPAEPDGVAFSIRFELGRKPQSCPARLRVGWACYVSAYDDVRLFYPRIGAGDQWRWSAIGEKPDMVVGETVHYQHRQRAFLQQDQALPLAYGVVGEYAVIMMFSDPGVSPFVVNSGGHLPFFPVQNPAWDFTWTTDDYPLHEPVGFDGQVIYTRFTGPEAVLERYHDWRKGLEGRP